MHRLLLGLLLLALAAPAHAQAAPDRDKRALVEALLHDTGYLRSLNVQARHMADEAASFADELPPEEAWAFLDEIDRTLKPARLHDLSVAFLLEHADADTLALALAWVHSPPVAPMVARERAAAREEGTPADSLARAAFDAELDALPAKERARRLHSARRIDRASGAAAWEAAVGEALMRAMLDGVASEFGAHEAEFRAFAEAEVLAGLEEFDEDAAARRYAYTYRDASEAELAAFADALATDVGQWELTVLRAATMWAFRDAFSEVGRALGSALLSAYSLSGDGVPPKVTDI